MLRAAGILFLIPGLAGLLAECEHRDDLRNVSLCDSAWIGLEYGPLWGLFSVGGGDSKLRV